MLKINENLFKGEDKARELNRKVIDCFLDRLATKDLNDEEKSEIASDIKALLDKNDDKAKTDSRFWYKYGVTTGEIKMWLKTASILSAGLIISKLFKK